MIAIRIAVACLLLATAATAATLDDQRLRAWRSVDTAVQGGGVPWSPADFGTNLVMWLSSAATGKMSIVATEIDRWTNSVTGNTNAFAAVNSFRRPGLTNETLNAYPVSSFLAGLDHGTWSGNADLTASPGVTIYYVMRLVSVPTGLAAPVQYQAGGSGSTRIYFGFNSSQRLFAQGRRADNDSVSTINTPTNQAYIATNNWALLGFTMNLPDQTAVMYANGSSIVTSNAWTTAGSAFDSTNSSSVVINNVNAQLNMAVADVIVLRNGAALTDVQKIDGWAAHRYALTGLLPGGHPYKSAGPTQ